MKELPIYNGDLLDTQNRKSDLYLCVNSCGIHRDESIHTVRKRGRVDYHILYVYKGSMNVVYHEKEYSVTSGGFVLYEPGTPQDYWQTDESDGSYWVHFSGNSVPELLKSSGLRFGVTQSPDPNPSRQVIHYFEKMILTVSLNLPYRDALAAGYLSVLFAMLGRSLTGGTNETDAGRLELALIYMRSHFREKIDLAYCSSLCSLSQSRFVHLFREAVGVSPYRYHLGLRLEHAAELLAFTDDTVKEIAFEVGFQDQLYFSRLFRKRYGISPIEFRAINETRTATSVKDSLQSSAE